MKLPVVAKREKSTTRTVDPFGSHITNTKEMNRSNSGSKRIEKKYISFIIFI